MQRARVYRYLCLKSSAMKSRLQLLLIIVMLSASCSQNTNERLPLANPADFVSIIDGRTTELFTLSNPAGVVVQITNYGGRVVSLFVPDRNGNMDDIVLGYPTLDGYLSSNEIYYGSLIGRYGNRIANGTFSLTDSTYHLARNNGSNHLHGGIKGFNNVVWDAVKESDQKLLLSYLSPDGEEGYPGNLTVNVTYELTDSNELMVTYRATTDKLTPINLTHHSFFNLKGAGNGDVNNHILEINADYYTPVNSELIPAGSIVLVEGSPFDFRTPTPIGERLHEDNMQLIYGNGYDHNWVLVTAVEGLTKAARVVEPETGRTLEVFTNEPALQFYGGNFLDNSDVGKYGKSHPFRGAFCLETQHYPDSPNQPAFPSTLLYPGREYYSVCIYVFGVE